MALLEGTSHRPLLARDKEIFETLRGQGQEILQMHRKLAPILPDPAGIGPSIALPSLTAGRSPRTMAVS